MLPLKMASTYDSTTIKVGRCGLPMKPTLKAPGKRLDKRLKLEHVKLLSNFAFNFNLRRYIKAGVINTPSCTVTGRVLRSSTSRINFSRFCRLTPNHPSNHLNSRQTTQVIDQTHGNPPNASLNRKPNHPRVSA